MLLSSLLTIAGCAALTTAVPLTTGTESSSNVERRGAIAARASGSPCTYSCPSKDKSNWGNVGQATASGTLTCYYYPTASQSTTYYCQYSVTSGALTKDGDAGFCVANAVQQCSRKRDVDPLARLFANRPAPVSSRDGEEKDAQARRSIMQSGRKA